MTRLLLVLMLLSTVAFADTIVMRNGQSMDGKIVDQDDAALKLEMDEDETHSKVTIMVPMDKVLRIEPETPEMAAARKEKEAAAKEFEEKMKADGKVKYKGKWVSEEEKSAAEEKAAAAKKKRDEERAAAKKKAEEEAAHKKAEQQKAAAEQQQRWQQQQQANEMYDRNSRFGRNHGRDNNNSGNYNNDRYNSNRNNYGNNNSYRNNSSSGGSFRGGVNSGMSNRFGR